MKIIITILVALLGLGGGAYYAQDSGLYDFTQLKQYIPSQVKDILNIEDNEETVSVSTNELEDLGIQTSGFPDQQMQQNPSYDNQAIQKNAQEAVSSFQESNQFQQPIPTSLNEGQNPEMQNSVAANVENTGENLPVDSNVIHNEENKLQNNNFDPQTADSQLAAKAVDAVVQEEKQTVVQELDASPEELKMVQELNTIESKIVKLDNENEGLQKKYSQMLKANRELALKLRDIDHQIKAIDAQ